MAGEVRSNLDQVLRGVRDLAGCLNMRAVGRYDLLGADLMDVAAQGIYDRTVLGQRDPEGGTLARLAEATLERKRRLGYPETIGVERGLMLAMEQLKGDRSVSASQATVVYGTDDRARQEAEWFQDPKPRRRRRQKRRPFFELDDAIEADLDGLVDEVVGNAVERNGG